jgi:UDP-N-acetylmuramoylalanine--D-glutamate ligase
MREYVEAKKNIFAHQKESDIAIFNHDNEVTRKYAEEAPSGEILFFSRLETVKDGTYSADGTIYNAKGGQSKEIMRVEDILLPGEHNVENFMAAFTAVHGLVSRKTMRETARTFQGVRHRLELVRELRGVRYYNDSIASSPTRAIAGLRAFGIPADGRKRVVLIAGGKDKGIAFDEFGAEILQHVKTLVLTGSTAEQIREAVVNAKGYEDSGLEILMCGDFKDAVILASKTAQDGDIVLLSPACTSFDRFKNFEERGDVFSEIVMGL